MLIVYAILLLWDTDANTGATVISPGSHRPDKVEFINRYRQEHKQQMEEDEEDEARFLKPFTECGLTAGPIKGTAGDLILFDTALFHGYCPALAPTLGSAPEGSGGLLRTACIMSMAPRLLLSPSIIKARQLYYELDVGTGKRPPTRLAARLAAAAQQTPRGCAGGSVMGRVGEAGAQQILADHAAEEEEGTARPRLRRFADASPEVRRVIGENFDFSGAPPESRSREESGPALPELVTGPRAGKPRL